jgi:putative transposase
MESSKVISKIKGIFRNSSPEADGRCKIQQPDFIAALVCGIPSQDGRTKSLSGLRKAVGEFTKHLLSRGAFWERMASRRLTKHLLTLLSNLISEVRVGLDIGTEVLQFVGVTKILIHDSSSFTLPDAASAEFPAPRNNVLPAAMKVHLLFDLFRGTSQWFDITPATTHDRKGFPPLELLKGALIIFDLGYWDFQLLKDMISMGIIFLSRVKSNSRVKITDVVSGASSSCIGFDLHSGRLDAFRGEIVELIGEFIVPKSREIFQTRILGFWCTDDHSYHWYATNLKVASILIYPLYRLRWQLELLWKSWKSIFHLDEITSTDRNIIFNLALAGMCAGLLAGALSISVVNEAPKEKQVAFSMQRAASFLLRIARELYSHIVAPLRSGKAKLMEMITLFEGELIDPNYKNRISSINRVYLELRRQE